MSLSTIDIVVFVAFYGLVLGVSLWKSRGRRTSEDYFLGGRQLPWWLIGVSIVAANISTEQFVGMAGQAAGDVGLAVSAWQLTGAVGIVVVAFTFLPRFLRAGIYTMPEYLEYRYSPAARTVMSVLTVVIYVTVTTTAVLYSGATALETIFGLSLPVAIAVICGIAIGYVLWGGLLAAVWADLFQGSALLVGGLLTLGLGLAAVGGPGAFLQANADRLHMILPRSHPELPWTVLVGGMWIPIFYYCGLNQFITQRTLAARSLRPGPGGDRPRRGALAPRALRDRDAGRDRAPALRGGARSGRTRPTRCSSGSWCRRACAASSSPPSPAPSSARSPPC